MNKDIEDKGVPHSMNQVLVLGALVFFFCMVVLLFVLCIYAILRRRVYIELPLRRHNPSWLQRLSSRREDRHLRPDLGLDVKIIETLPMSVYTSQRLKPGGTECSVCLSDFEDGEKVRVLPDCKHSFHTECIDMWFHSHSNCPLCRTKVEAKINNIKLEDDMDTSNGEENVVIDMNFAVEGGQSSCPSTSRSFAEMEIDLSTGLNSLSLERESEEISSPSGSRFCRIHSFKRMLSGRSRDGKVFPSSLHQPQNEIEEFS
ncbi:hypothetical protein SUGI_0786220 [Cryptomeria japonica]|uniref:RING-H2 finger protein ATL72 n=1 Tax=Cryptomeria japonica TaxID=3369 RepID=UPI0024148D76|nr:RING-H2 finger protein ATL72 [Cryptomeria japonica]GLJ38562.1 hypothetical protein SUGI_0786220 [Cryptomeria japonica]